MLYCLYKKSHGYLVCNQGTHQYSPIGAPLLFSLQAAVLMLNKMNKLAPKPGQAFIIEEGTDPNSL